MDVMNDSKGLRALVDELAVSLIENGCKPLAVARAFSDAADGAAEKFDRQSSSDLVELALKSGALVTLLSIEEEVIDAPISQVSGR